MLSTTEIGVMATAGIGGFTMIWGNIRGIFSRLESLFIVKSELSANMGDDFMNYCWAHFRPSPIGIRRFHGNDYFIRSKNRVGRVATEGVGSFITFWKGWRPIFVSFCQDSNRNNGNTSISFIRGTFKLEDLIVDASHFCDIFKHEKNDTGSRYYVKQVFGRKMSKNGGEIPDSGEAKIIDSGAISPGIRPLFYTKEDLGSPTSKNPIENLSYEGSVLEFYQEASRWKESEKWFRDKGLPWRFGAGLFGPAGTGKSSLARAIGQSLDIPIHSYDLTTMDNEELVRNWRSSLGESPCIVLLEDLDRIFDENRQIKTYDNKSPLTLDCLLNCISGVQPSNGILILITANDISKLDPALGVPDSTGKSSRPGRLDRSVYVGILSRNGREKIAARILADASDLVEKTVLEGEGETGAQFESRCSKLALDRYWGRTKVCEDNKIKRIFSLDLAANRESDQ